MLFVNGNQVSLPNGLYNYNDSTYLPLRQLGELLGAEVDWHNEEKVAHFVLNGVSLEIINQTNTGVVTSDGNTIVKPITANVKGKDVPVPALNINGSTFLPTRYVSETLGLQIKYNANHPETGQKTITIGNETGLNYSKPEAPKPPTPTGEVDPINEGKLPTAPDGVDYNAKWLDYLKGDKLFLLNKASGNRAWPKEDGDFNKLFTQTHPRSGAKAIPGLFYVSNQGFIPVFDHNGDGKLGDTPIGELSVDNIDAIDKAANRESEINNYRGAAREIEYVIRSDNQFKS